MDFNVQVLDEKQADIREINKLYNEWLKQFPNSTAISSLIGLKRECDECIKSIIEFDTALKEKKLNEAGVFEIYHDPVRMEYADLLMYLIDSARRFGLSLDDLFFALNERLIINKNRDWKINEDKSYSHVKS